MLPLKIRDLTLQRDDLADQAAHLLHDAFLGRTEDWQDIDAARAEVLGSLASDRISRIALNDDGHVTGWIGAIATYDDRVWEIHPLVVSRAHRRQGIGHALVQDVEHIAAARGGLTLWLGSDDENGETTASGVDLYADISAAIRDLKYVRGEHPFGFYVRLGFQVTGFLPDANGRGKPDIFFAKRIGAGR